MQQPTYFPDDSNLHNGTLKFQLNNGYVLTSYALVGIFCKIYFFN
jgi:hypothetical protein